MTGTGTATDPYVVDNWADFVTAVAESGVYVSCPENAVWDMNEIAPTGIATVNIYAAQIDGNGLTIRNLYLAGDGYGLRIRHKCTINKLHFINFYKAKGTGAFIYHQSYGVTFNLCKLSGIIDSEAFTSKSSTAMCYFNRCSLNLEFNENSYIVDHYSGGGAYCLICCTNCIVKIGGNSGSTVDHSNYLINCIRLRESLLIGECPFKQIRFTDDSSNAGESYNSVIDMNIADDVVVYNLAGETTAAISNLLVNSDKAGATALLFEGFTPVTTAQLQSAEYLSSIGFPIGVN